MKKILVLVSGFSINFACLSMEHSPKVHAYTKDLTIREWCLQDADQLSVIAPEGQDEEESEPAISLQEAQETIKHIQHAMAQDAFGWLVIEHTKTGQLIGACGAIRTIHTHPTCLSVLGDLIITKNYRTKGYGTQAAHAILAHAFTTHRLETVSVPIKIADEKAQLYAQKMGLIESSQANGTYKIYSITKDAWESKKRT